MKKKNKKISDLEWSLERIGRNTPKAFIKKVLKVHGHKKSYSMTVKQPIPKKIVEYYERLLLGPSFHSYPYVVRTLSSKIITKDLNNE